MLGKKLSLNLILTPLVDVAWETRPTHSQSPPSTSRECILFSLRDDSIGSQSIFGGVGFSHYEVIRIRAMHCSNLSHGSASVLDTSFSIGNSSRVQPQHKYQARCFRTTCSITTTTFPKDFITCYTTHNLGFLPIIYCYTIFE
ncbi:hypothetical protein L873DRAFT_57772 [Choiromyces venosus 120613-1]|uniref:Uncharacterized protein n=1 Tax=Choiromyces venosus 120613-1 TaxID=1336337 RepID=A0A3N4J5B1_9PEZI|nr:hypothetical protein L873DRAFT_57772 [Choiromyces venosus 120613-1]